MSKTKREAVRLLRKYDQAKRDLRDLERELSAACRAYGVEQGYVGWFHHDNLRTTLIVEAEERLKREAEKEQGNA